MFGSFLTRRPLTNAGSMNRLIYLAGSDPRNALRRTIAAVVGGNNFRRLLEWPALLLSIILGAFSAAANHQKPLEPT